MALAARRGAVAFPELALGLREAYTGLQGVNAGMLALGSTARIAVVGLTAVTLGVAAVGAAVVAYGISVFKFSREMYTLGQAARGLGLTLGALRNLTEQNERFGISAENTIGQLGRLQEAITDLQESGSQLRNQLIGRGLDPTWLDQYARETNLIKQQNMARERMLAIRDAEIARGKTLMAAQGEAARFARSIGQDPGIMFRAAAREPTKEEAAQMQKVDELSQKINDHWIKILETISKIKTEILAWGLPTIEATMGKIAGWAEKFAGYFEHLPEKIEAAKKALRDWGVIPPEGGFRDPYATPHSRHPMFKRSGFEGANDNNPLLQNASFGGVEGFGGGGGGDSAKTIMKSAVFEALIDFYNYLKTGGTGGAGGVVPASFGGTAGAAAARLPGAAGFGGGGYTNLTGKEGGDGQAPSALDKFMPGWAKKGGGLRGTVPRSVQSPTETQAAVDPNQVPSGGLVDPMTGKLGGGLGDYRSGGGGHAHQGLDILGAKGSPIYSSGSGTIVKHSPQGSYQKDAVTTIKLDDGRTVRYMHHNLDPSLKVGSHVTAGQAIGTSGRAAGVDHLHYEIRDAHGNLLDPIKAHGWARGTGGQLPTAGRVSEGGRTVATTPPATPPVAASPAIPAPGPGADAAPQGATLTGTASWYQPGVGYQGGGPSTSTGERYDPNEYSAAINQSMRGQFGGVTAKSGPGYALVKTPDGKSAIVKINDVMGASMNKSGRVIDLNRRSMGALGDRDKGLIPGTQVTPLPGYRGATGPAAAEMLRSKTAAAEPDVTKFGEFGGGYNQYTGEKASNELTDWGWGRGGGNQAWASIIRRGQRGLGGDLENRRQQPYPSDEEWFKTFQAKQQRRSTAMGPETPLSVEAGSSDLEEQYLRKVLGFDEPDRGALDRNAVDRQNGASINSTGKLSVDVNAPPGTKVDYNGDNLLRATSMQRQTQMMPTDTGPSVADTARSYMRGGSY